jgi:hypothetical protein
MKNENAINQSKVRLSEGLSSGGDEMADAATTGGFVLAADSAEGSIRAF